MDFETSSIAQLLANVESASSIARKRHARQALEHALRFADPGQLDHTLAARALPQVRDPQLLARAEAMPAQASIGVPLFASTHANAIARLFHVAYDFGQSTQNQFGMAATLQIATALELAAKLHPPPRPASFYGFFPAVPEVFREIQIDGESLGLATYLSAVAHFSHRPMAPRIAATGRFIGEQILGVTKISEKVLACVEQGYTTLILPLANLKEAQMLCSERQLKLTLRGVATPHDLPADLWVHEKNGAIDWRQEVDRAYDLFRAGWSSYRWREVHDEYVRILGLLPRHRIDLFTEVSARLAATERHLGHFERCEQILVHTQSVLRESSAKDVPDTTLSAFYQQRSMTSLALGNTQAALRRALVGLSLAERSRDRPLVVKALGCLGLAEQGIGEFARAASTHERCFALAQLFSPREVSRSRAYWIEAQGFLGHVAKSRELYQSALSEGIADPWLHVAFARAMNECENFAEADHALHVDCDFSTLTQQPMPGTKAFREAARAANGLVDPTRALALLDRCRDSYASTPGVHHIYLETNELVRAHILRESAPNLALRLRLA